MRRATTILLLLAGLPGLAFPQSRSSSRPPQKTADDRLGMTCSQILKMSSTEWIADFADKAHVAELDASSGLSRAIGVYGKCYDERTDRLAASLAKTGKGPLMGARGDFRDFEAALKNFAAKALADAAIPADEKKKAYAALYEKQFRYEFYEEYQAKTVKPAVPPAKSPASAAKSTAVAPAAAPAPPAVGGAAPSTTGSAATAQERARSDADPVTQAKNRFGKLLEVLPDDKMHELHRAFGDVIGPYHISEATRLAVYRYAIFLLEPLSATPQSQPPF